MPDKESRAYSLFHLCWKAKSTKDSIHVTSRKFPYIATEEAPLLYFMVMLHAVEKT